MLGERNLSSAQPFLLNLCFIRVTKYPLVDVDMQRFSSSVSHINDLGATCILCRFADCLPRPEPLPDADYQPQTGTPFQTSRGELLFNRIISPSLTS